MGSLGEEIEFVKGEATGQPKPGDGCEPLPSRVLNKMELNLLQRGLSFIPKGVGMTSWNRLEAEADLTAYHRRLKLADFFEGEEGGQRVPFTGPSEWEPRGCQVGECVWRIIEEDKKVIGGVKEVWEESNLLRGEWEALKGLRADQ